MKLPPFDIYPSLSDDKVLLRQVLTSDIQDLIVISYYDSVQAKTIEQATEMQQKIDMDYMNANSIHWGIIDHSTNKTLGTCGYYRGFDQGIGELGCVLLPQYIGQGFMTAAIQLAIDFGLTTIGLKRITAITTKQNLKAIQLLQRLNFTKIADLKDDDVQYEFLQNTKNK